MSRTLILELFSMITEPLGLSSWTLRAVMVVPGLGFVVSLDLSWNYDFTAERLGRNC
ncbi:MAG: hypothetical protein KAK04_03810 [Cyclobacteriaceae bacterium]|nr:hypothetical protein [Cyclobacteriaceae bacterium]